MSNIAAAAANKPNIFADAKTREFHSKTLVWDCLSLIYILDEPYAQQALEGGVNVTNCTFSTEEDWNTCLSTFEMGLEKIEKSPLLKLALTSADILEAQREGKLAIVIGTQGSAMLDQSVYRLEILYRLGLRIFGLAYTGPTMFADGCGERRDAGLSTYGHELIERVNQLGLILDLSHAGHRARAEAVALANAPVGTHSNSYTVNANDRNTKDDVAKTVAAKGGVMGVCALPKPIWPENATLDRLIDHVDYYVKLLGYRHVGFGGDFVAAYKAAKQILPASLRWRTLRPDVFGTVDEFFTQSYPEGFSEIRELPNFTQRLFDRGYNEEQTVAIMGGNWLRCFKEKIA
jgi:membrane dipeptidase